jgi:hypothetical protein
MLRQLLVVCVLCFIALGSSIPIVISRYGGSSRQQRERYLMEERQRVNTCCVARMVNPDIKIGECPNIINEYKQLYARDSVCFLNNYYKHRCDIVFVKENCSHPLCAFLGALFMSTFMLTFSFTVISCICCLIKAIYVGIVSCITFMIRVNH